MQYTLCDMMCYDAYHTHCQMEWVPLYYLLAAQHAHHNTGLRTCSAL